MKKYYLHNGTDQQGPFDMEDLKAKLINKDTAIWYEGLSDWTTADKIEELKDLLNTTTPPPFKTKQSPTPLNERTAQTEPKQSIVPNTVPKKKNNIRNTVIIVVIIVIVGGLAIFDKMRIGNGYGTDIDTYQEKVMTVEEIERSQPTNFLSADGEYNENFWGTKIKVHGVITNKATVATYKDAIVRVTYYSKTKTELANNDYTIYESFPPHSSTNFELKIDKYKDANSIGWEVIQATAD